MPEIYFNHRSVLILFLCWQPMVLSAQPEFEGNIQPITALNSVFDEDYLVLDRNGAEMAFTRLKHIDNPGGSVNPGDIWISRYDSAWSMPQPYGFRVKESLEVPLSLSGRQLLFAVVTEKYNAFTTETFVRGDSEKNRQLYIPYFVNKSPVISGNLSADGQYLLLSMESTVTKGVEDIYVSVRQGTAWQPPKNLGAVINTPFQEITPFLASDGKTLFWSGNGRGGAGSFDVFQSTRLDDTWQNWSDPINIGSPVNTEGSETSFSLVGEYAYFISTRDSDGYGDVKRIRLKNPVEEAQDSVFVMEMEEDRSIIFEVRDENNNQPVKADFRLTSVTLDTLAEGVSELPLNFAEWTDVRVVVNAKGYLPLEEFLTATQLSETQVRQFRLKRLSIGTTIRLKNVLFEKGTVDFIEGSASELDRVVMMLQQNPEMKIVIKGHTDNQGDPALNLKLSQSRARKVRDYIFSMGINKDRVQSKGYGGSLPVASNRKEETRRLNRRVAFTIVEQ